MPIRNERGDAPIDEVARALRLLPGVEEATLGEGSVVIRYDENVVSEAELIAAVGGAGFDVPGEADA
jgi:copper chaperone CopZ